MLIVYGNLEWSKEDPYSKNYKFNKEVWQKARKWIEENMMNLTEANQHLIAKSPLEGLQQKYPDLSSEELDILVYAIQKTAKWVNRVRKEDTAPDPFTERDTEPDFHCEVDPDDPTASDPE